MTMTDALPGIRGAKLQTWKPANPRELLKRIIDDNPGTDRQALLHLFRDQMWREEGAEEYVDTIIEYWFANNYHSLVGPQPAFTQAQSRTRSADVVRALRERVQAKIVERANIVLSDMVLPNGKRLADCSGKECAQMGAALGGLIGRIAQHVKPKQIVGAVLTEVQLQDMYVAKT